MTSASHKTVVVSDFHISNGAKYSWFRRPCPENAAAMFTSISNDSSVDELVLLGDVFDLWLYPLDVVPWTVNKISNKYPLITKALQMCVQNIANVYYLRGNHDMGVAAKDLQAFSSGGRQIQLIDPDSYNTKHHGRLHIEHGHAVDMFNARDTATDTIGGYPLGFFITRLAATAADQSAVWRELTALLQALGLTHKALVTAGITVPTMGVFFVDAIITLLEKLAGVDDSARIRFSDPTLDKKYMVGDIKRHYNTLYTTWLARYPDYEEFLNTMLAGLLPSGLDWYANKLFSENPALKVVVMGHTHFAKTVGGYYNDGCWCVPSTLGQGKATPSYVQIVGGSPTLIYWKP